jgi:vacuolar-type H+-ATPase subunit D/Vma8
MSHNSDQKVASQLKSQPKQSDGLEIFQPFIDQTSEKVSEAVSQIIVNLNVEKTFNKLGNFISDTEHIWKAYEGKFQPLSGSPEPKAIAGN